MQAAIDDGQVQLVHKLSHLLLQDMHGHHMRVAVRGMLRRKGGIASSSYSHMHAAAGDAFPREALTGVARGPRPSGGAMSLSTWPRCWGAMVPSPYESYSTLRGMEQGRPKAGTIMKLAVYDVAGSKEHMRQQHESA